MSSPLLAWPEPDTDVDRFFLESSLILKKTNILIDQTYAVQQINIPYFAN